MITSDAGFVIATPTKCGTTTLEEMCRRHRGGRAHPGLPSFRIMDWEKPRRQHRMALPVGLDWGNADRYLMVRDPRARYCSMYEYLRAPHNYSKFGARETQGRVWGGWQRGRVGLETEPLTFEQFLMFVARQRDVFRSGRWYKRRGDLYEPFAYRSPWVWLDGLDVSYGAFAAQPGGARGEVTCIRLERFWESMAALKDRYGLVSLSVRPTVHANRTLTYGGKSVDDYWDGVQAGVQESVGIRAETDVIRASEFLA